MGLRSGQSYNHGIFKGGSLSVAAINSTRIRLTSYTVWDLDSGPCAGNCKPGLSTQAWRSQLVNQSGNPSIIGRWYTETLDRLGNLQKLDFTDQFNSHCQGEVLQVSTQERWVLEKAQLDISIPPLLDFVDVVLEGFSWTPELNPRFKVCRHQQGGPDSGCPYHLQTKFYPGIRNDTGAPNHTPTALVRPIYKVVPGQKKKIPLAILDSDNDIYRCRPARFVELGSLYQMNGVTVERDCSITVEPASNTVGDIGVVNVIVEDASYATVKVGDSRVLQTFEGISATQVQFMVQVVSQSRSPEFIYPTSCGINGVKGVNLISGATLHLPLHARPSNSQPSGTKIKFAVRAEPDDGHPPFMSSLRRSDDNVSWIDLESNVTGDGLYWVEILAIDTEGEESVCFYKVRVKPLVYSLDLYTNFTSGPVLSLPDNVDCEVHSLCAFPVFGRGDQTFLLVDIPLNNSDKRLINITSKEVGSTVLNSTTTLQKDITIESKQIGHVEVCFAALDFNRKTTYECTSINIMKQQTSHPCIANETLCGRYAKCNPNPDNISDFLCDCRSPNIHGRFCEISVNTCDNNYCGNNSEQCLYDPAIAPLPFCLCKKNYVGKVCDKNVLCSPDPCAPHGNCTADDQSTSPLCVCDEGYAGADCSEKRSPLTLSFNATEVTCKMSTRLDWLDLPADLEAVSLMVLTLSLKDETGEDQAVWSVNVFNSSPTVAGKNLALATSAQVEVTISSSGPALLRLTWPLILPGLEGTYECTIGVLDSLGKPHQFSQRSVYDFST
ncbi:neurogenic locus notch homolog protein 2 [Elysia marginata]|uniref:Neurogenic locus notch homolog protein 2 n=1 Tax=Elysia marginata TaxID=1093978 RepID=A0AAV4JD97_9GAST|nr:neurogenic locus notch homolog protein 2 [Elysia marginata]